jgi:hypothetical protein
MAEVTVKYGDGFEITGATTMKAPSRFSEGHTVQPASDRALALPRCPDGSTYVTCLTAFSANGYATVELPPGQYQLAVASATVNFSLAPIPYRPDAG